MSKMQKSEIYQIISMLNETDLYEFLIDLYDAAWKDSYCELIESEETVERMVKALLSKE